MNAKTETQSLSRVPPSTSHLILIVLKCNPGQELLKPTVTTL